MLSLQNPRYAVYAHDAVDMERELELVEVRHDEDVAGRVLRGWQMQVLRQVYHCDDLITRLKDALDIRLRVLHGLYGAVLHDLCHLCDIYAKKLPRDGEFHDLELIRPGFQQNLCLFILACHIRDLPAISSFMILP